jgi:hypothetical protein
VYQVGQENDVAYLAMELLAGRSLEAWLAQAGRPAPAAILRIGREIAGGLVAIHRHGLIHRDLKPANLWVEEPGGRVKLLDFGLARFVHDDAALTHEGAVLGTPCFMAPEQARGEPVDARSDLFSFGCVLYALCTGASPFHAVNSTAALTALAVDEPRPVRDLNPAVPKALSDLIARLLAKDPADRPASAAAVLARLRRLEEAPDSSSGTQRLTPTGRPAVRSSRRTPRARKRPAPRRPWLKPALAVVLTAGAALALGWAASFLFRAGTVGAAAEDGPGQGPVYLSALEPSERESWPIIPPPPPGMPPIRPIGVRVQGKERPHGIFMHAAHPPQAAGLTYRLGGAYRSFRAEVSLNDGPPRSESPCTFAVYGDGRLLWKSAPVSTQADAQTCTVDVQGVDRLKLEVRCAGAERGAHAVWIEPSLSR